MRNLLFIIYIFSISAVAQTTLKISSTTWSQLSPEEKSLIQRKALVETIAPDSYGVIIDNQGVDRSTQGSNAGSSLGEAVANATYIDKAIGGGNYSAKNHLGALLLGGIIGSALDSKPQASFQHRYAVRLGNGNIAYHDTYSAEPFRHPAGVCVFLPEVSIAAEQSICSQTAESLREIYVVEVKKSAVPAASEARNLLKNESVVSASSEMGKGQVSDFESVNCRISTLAPVKTSREKCMIVNGVVIND